MNPIDIVVIAVIVLVIGGVSVYIIRAKKKGQKCIGCPYAKQCGKCGCSCGGDK